MFTTSFSTNLNKNFIQPKQKELSKIQQILDLKI